MENGKTVYNNQEQAKKAKLEVLGLLKTLLKNPTNGKIKLDKESAMYPST